MMTAKKLNLGCGTDIRSGWVNLDKYDLPGVEVVHDLEVLPLPFSDHSFDEILCQDILEHVAYPVLLKELYRILKKEGVLKIRVPHFTSKNNFIDPTHQKMFSVRTFYFFVTDHGFKKYHRKYYFDFSFRKITSLRITFEGSSRFFFYNRFIEWVVNRSEDTQYLYEATGFSRIFPAENIEITLIK